LEDDEVFWGGLSDTGYDPLYDEYEDLGLHDKLPPFTYASTSRLAIADNLFIDPPNPDFGLIDPPDPDFGLIDPPDPDFGLIDPPNPDYVLVDPPNPDNVFVDPPNPDLQ
jgi:hypothetical protein